jgi:hypothetical protein
MKKSFLFGLGLGFATTFWFFRLPFSYGSKLTGYVIASFIRDNGDVVIKLNNDKHDFIISHGTFLNIDIKKLQSKLISRQVEIWYTHPRWPLDTTPRITRLVSDGEVIYSKW